MSTETASTSTRLEPIVISSSPGCPVPIEDLDDGIRELVIALNRDGLTTSASCEGGEGHAFELPTVVFETSDLETTRREVSEWMTNHGVHGFTVNVKYLHQSSTTPEDYSHVSVEIWSQDILRYLTF